MGKPQPIEYLILERSVLTDRYVFMKVMETELEPAFKTMYASWFDLHCRLLPFDLKKAHFVYLQTSAEESTSRMNKRGRPQEVLEKESKYEDPKHGKGVSLDYQRCLHAAHLELFKTLSHTTLLDEKLCLADFTKPTSAGFLNIIKVLSPVLKVKEKDEHKNEECDRSYLASWDRLC
jgi:deoxyadenosine/deoxycytidine kinase